MTDLGKKRARLCNALMHNGFEQQDIIHRDATNPGPFFGHIPSLENIVPFYKACSYVAHGGVWIRVEKRVKRRAYLEGGRPREVDMRAPVLRVNRVLCEKVGENRQEMFTCQIDRDAAKSGCRLPTYQPTDARYELLIQFLST
jgi:hypothetical protein